MKLAPGESGRPSRSRPLRRSSLRGDAYSFLYELLVNTDRFKPGDKISIEELSRELGVSRTPLWSAIGRLEADGIVQVIPRLGVYVVNHAPQQVIDVYLTREALEGAVARLAAEKITDRQLANLSALVSDQSNYLKSADMTRYDAAALEFHEQIMRAAQNEPLQRLLSSVFSQIKAMRVQRRYAPNDYRPSCDDHARLLQALRLRDPDRAERESRAHIRALTCKQSQKVRPHGKT